MKYEWKCMKEWMKERMNERKNEWKKRKNERREGWKEGTKEQQGSNQIMGLYTRREQMDGWIMDQNND